MASAESLALPRIVEALGRLEAREGGLVERVAREAGMTVEEAGVASACGFLRLQAPEEAWEDHDDEPDGRLGVGVLVSGVLCHLQAMRVEVDERGVQVGAGPYPEDYESLCRLYEPDGDFTTLRIRGKDYVVYMTPGS